MNASLSLKPGLSLNQPSSRVWCAQINAGTAAVSTLPRAGRGQSTAQQQLSTVACLVTHLACFALSERLLASAGPACSPLEAPQCLSRCAAKQRSGLARHLQLKHRFFSCPQPERAYTQLACPEQGFPLPGLQERDDQHITPCPAARATWRSQTRARNLHDVVLAEARLCTCSRLQGRSAPWLTAGSTQARRQQLRRSRRVQTGLRHAQAGQV